MTKPRVMYVLSQYPQISETYIKTEIDALRDDYEIRVISIDGADLPYKNCYPYRQISDPAQICEAIEEFRPHVLHAHWIIFNTRTLADMARKTNTPFTIRAHSFDSIWKKPPLLDRVRGKNLAPTHILDAVPLVNDDLCLGVLAFPFVLPHFEKVGMRGDKLHACYPVVNYALFHDRSPNGAAVMNTGACLPKKQFEIYLELAKSLPGTECNLYAMGYDVERIRKLNEEMGRPVNMMPPTEHDDMPREYKKHRWLVYTASREIGTVGWSLSIAEAQASGVGVCAPNLRPDIKEYVGNCGFIYDSISEVRDIITKPFPEEMRQNGFDHARKSDIQNHKHLLTNLWRKAIPKGL